MPHIRADFKHLIFKTYFSVSATRNMEKSYEKVIDFLGTLKTNASVLESIRQSGGKLNDRSLPEMREYCRRIGYEVPRDFDKLNIIHISGSKGKGSVCMFTESILRNLRHMDGMPRLRFGICFDTRSVRERIRIDGKKLNKEDFTNYCFEVCERLNKAEAANPGMLIDGIPINTPEYFRFLTLLAFHSFMRKKVDVAIIEVGIGGAYDPTNIIEKPIVCGVASLGYEHQSLLGHTLASIAWNKGGIFKHSVPAVTVEQQTEGMKVLMKRAEEAPLKQVQPLTKESLHGATLGLPGDHQLTNAALAIELCRVWLQRCHNIRISEQNPPREFMKGLQSAHYPGRGHIVNDQRYPKITWFLDGAHTAESIKACAKWFSDVTSQHAEANESTTERILLFSCTKDRIGQPLLEELGLIHQKNRFDHAVFCTNIPSLTNNYKIDLHHNTVEDDPTLSLQHTLAETWKGLVIKPKNAGHTCDTHVLPTIEHAINWITEYSKKTDASLQVLVTGSLHLIGGFMAILEIDVD
ncbi:1019_t:CDS:10 [Paraglomus brasilianum]|uniref:Folylpolyglutamate synthase n=1 Tax=Paraglomus brasilianum TaxID=144538 RepID=A0A9N8VKX0_9GLOM|nr:1019_t:CDS:10 [Paraglomus brasilianum]